MRVARASELPISARIRTVSIGSSRVVAAANGLEPRSAICTEPEAKAAITPLPLPSRPEQLTCLAFSRTIHRLEGFSRDQRPDGRYRRPIVTGAGSTRQKYPRHAKHDQQGKQPVQNNQSTNSD